MQVSCGWLHASVRYCQSVASLFVGNPINLIAARHWIASIRRQPPQRQRDAECCVCIRFLLLKCLLIYACVTLHLGLCALMPKLSLKTRKNGIRGMLQKNLKSAVREMPVFLRSAQIGLARESVAVRSRSIYKWVPVSLCRSLVLKFIHYNTCAAGENLTIILNGGSAVRATI